MEEKKEERKKITAPMLTEMKQKGQKFSMITCYDYPFAVMVDAAGIDVVLVGDSLGMTMLGYETTLPVTMDMMIHHAKAVRRGLKYPLLIGDMPFMAYQASVEEAVRNAGRFMKEAECDAIKLEGGASVIPQVKAIVQSGIPMMGHLGLTPQSIFAFGGFKAQGRSAMAAKKILDDALALEDAGAFAVLLECVPMKVSEIITKRLTVPTVSIGAGLGCDGQCLIFHDMFGMFPRFTPKFVKKYGNVYDVVVGGLKQFADDIQKQVFPEEQHGFKIPDAEFQQFLDLTK
jgi:3-methyl-2-oxobutanoate hydroxymethyltransferase